MLLLVRLTEKHHLNPPLTQEITNKEFVVIFGTAEFFNKRIVFEITDFQDVFTRVVVIILVTKSVFSVAVIVYREKRRIAIHCP